MTIVCIVCQERVSPLKGDVRIECLCGMLYHALSGQLVDEPVCGMLELPATSV